MKIVLLLSHVTATLTLLFPSFSCAWRGADHSKQASQSILPSVTTSSRQIYYSRTPSQPCRSTVTLSMNADRHDTDILRFLGRGERAIVRPGVVLLAPWQEFHHFYRQAAIFIYAMGDRDDGSAYVIRGLIVDHPTVFTLGEMMEHQPSMVQNPLANNLLFRGGDCGGDGVILLHNWAELAQSCAVGDSGLYQGGWSAALRACANGADTGRFKAFFNYCEFTETELEQMLAQQGDNDQDAWVSLEVDPAIVLNSAWDRGEAWTRLRNSMKQYSQ